MKEKPNIILINCDDMGYGDLGCYGSPVNQTPCIDMLARQGIRFTECYAPSPVCSPSRGGMLTGCYPPRISFGKFEGYWVLFPGQGVGLSRNEETIASVLKSAGYATGMIGKWHCGDQKEFLPPNFGFDSYYGLPYSNDMGRQVGNDGSSFTLRSTFPPLPLLKDHNVVEEQPDLATLTERYTERATDFIQLHQDTPFFLYFAHMYVHRPLYAHESFQENSRNGIYGASMACVDWSTSVIVRTLDKLGIRDNTMIIFTSDNGSRGIPEEGCSNAPLRGAKGTTWEGGMRVPCIVNWPARIPAGMVCDELISALDFLPTLSSIAGASTSRKHIIDGQDLSDLWLGKTTSSPRDHFAYYYMNDLNAVRDSRYKLHLARDGKPVCELYDLKQDPEEKQDVHAILPEIVESLSKTAEGYRHCLGDAVTGCEGREIRDCGHVENPKMLTQYDPSHPYIIAMYDKEDCG